MAPAFAEYEPTPNEGVCDFMVASGNEAPLGYFERAMVAEIDARDKTCVRTDYVNTRLHDTYTALVDKAMRVRAMLRTHVRKGRMAGGEATRTFIDYVAYACDRVRLTVSPDAPYACAMLRTRDRAGATVRVLRDYDVFKDVVLK